MSDLILWHNPRCSKSRQALQLLQERGISPTVYLYLENPPSQDALRALLRALNQPARALLRSNEEAYKTLQLADETLDEAALIQAMHTHPKLIERPILQHASRAVIGRPPENILQLL